jgi:hypothetical protein
MFLPFSRSAGQAAEKQKVSFILEGSRSLIAPINSNAAELHFLGFIRSFLKANAATQEINQVNPVRKHYGFRSK